MHGGLRIVEKKKTAKQRRVKKTCSSVEILIRTCASHGQREFFHSFFVKYYGLLSVFMPIDSAS